MMDIKLELKGIKEAQQRNVKMIRALQPQSAFGRLVRDVLENLFRFLRTVVHVRTGSLKAAQRMQWQGGLRGEIFTDPMVTNPVSGQRPAIYGVFENARGGDHAFIDRTVQAAPGMVQRGVRDFLNNL